MILGLTNLQLKCVCNILKKYLADTNVSVAIFGSRAEGKHRPNSDLDLLISEPMPISSATIEKLKEAFEESDLPFSVDLVREENIPTAVKSNLSQSRVIKIYP